MSSARTARAVAAFAAIVLGSVVQPSSSSSADEKRVTIYSIVSNYSLPVVERNGQDYTGLLEALEPLGGVSATAAGEQWTLRYNDVEAEFTAGSTQARVRRGVVDLAANFLLENQHGLVPVASLGNLLSRILGGPVSQHESSRRIFIGSIAVHFTAQISKANPPTVTMNFTSPVNPTIATEPGKLHMVFSREPLVEPGSRSLTFDNKTIPSATYQEDNGAAEITVASAAPLFASFSNGNHTITISAAQAAETASAKQAQAQPPAVPTTPVTGLTQAAGVSVPGSATHPSSSVFFAVVDASHGGSERGEALSNQLAEKDVTLAFARSLRQELRNRGLTALVLRDGDATFTPDQRASMANLAHPAIYICLHASSEGHGVRLYTALLPAGGEDSGPFLDWNTAQTAFLPLSKSAAAGLAVELQKQQIPVRVLMAPLRPLNNIATAAVAVEVAPPATGIADLNSATYQQQVAASMANGLLALRDKLEGGR